MNIPIETDKAKLYRRGDRTQVFSIPTTVLIQKVGILIRILFATQI